MNKCGIRHTSSELFGSKLPSREININDRVIVARRNLYELLYSARGYGLRPPIWVDAIYINHHEKCGKEPLSLVDESNFPPNDKGFGLVWSF